MAIIRYKNSLYREASTIDIALQIVSFLWDWIYKSGFTKEQVISILEVLFDLGQKLASIPKNLIATLQNTANKVGVSKILETIKYIIQNFAINKWPRTADTLPENIVASILQFLSKTKLEVGEFILLLDAAISNDPTPLLTDAKLQTKIPTTLASKILGLLSSQSLDFIEFMEAVDDALDKPPPGYRWRVDEYGKRILARIGHKTTKEPAIIKGKRFVNSMFIGVWWQIPKEQKSLSGKILAWLGINNGDTFLIKEHRDTLEYFGFAILDKSDVNSTYEICSMVKNINNVGDARVSVISMVGIAEHRAVYPEDFVPFGCIRSLKYNWKYNIIDVLNGRVTELHNSGKYNDLISHLRAL